MKNIKPFYNLAEKMQWFAHNCANCEVKECVYQQVLRKESEITSILADEIGMAWDNFLEPNCKHKSNKQLIKQTKQSKIDF